MATFGRHPKFARENNLGVLKFLDMLWVLASGIVMLVLSAIALYRILVKGEPLRQDCGDLSCLPKSWKHWILDEKPAPKCFGETPLRIS